MMDKFLITSAEGDRYHAAQALAQEVRAFLLEQNKIAHFSTDLGTYAANPDFIIAVGGDGTIMRAMKKYEAPVFGIRADVEDSLGFLAAADYTNWQNSLNKALSGEYDVEGRMALDFTWRGKTFGPIINEVSVRHEEYPVYFKVKINHEVWSPKLWTRGLLVATSTGAFAENFSSGGHPLARLSEDVALTTINPQRPVMIPYPFPEIGLGGSIEIEFLPGKYDGMVVDVKCDGRKYTIDGDSVHPGESIVIRKHPKRLLLATFGLKQHMDAMRRKGFPI